jgi:ubiquinone/menaquinone biosynthesis C-methylase UbiE
LCDADPDAVFVKENVVTDPSNVPSHYGVQDHRERVREALALVFPETGVLSWRDLEPLDQFHVRGLAATQELASSLKITPETAILDVGCGLGGPSRYLAASFGCHVVGIDLNQSYIDVAEMLSERVKLSHLVSYRQADALELPMAAASFDLAWTQHVAMNISDRARLYRGIHRVLKPSGQLAIYDVIAGEGGPIVFPVPWAREAGHNFLLTAEAMRGTLETEGFAVESWEDKTEEGMKWLTRQRTARQAQAPAQALGLHVVMGPDFPGMTSNLERNFREGRARLAQAVLRRI